MYELPTTVNIDGHEYAVRDGGDFRTILDCISLIQDADLTDVEKAISALMVFLKDFDEPDDVIEEFMDLNVPISEMFKFISCNDEQVGYTVNHKVMDWEQDEKLIISAINGVAKTEVRSLKYLHWWTFISYFMAIGECSFSTIVSIRDKLARGKKLEKYEREFKRYNPQYFIWKQEQLENNKLIEQLWNKS